MDKIMKDFSKDALQEGARPLFEEHRVDTLYATSDGQYFLKKGPAANHAGQKLALYELYKGDQASTAKPEKGMTIADLSAFVEGITDITELTELKKKEESGEKRVGAFKVIDLRIAVLVVGQSEDPEALKAQLEAEKAGEKRKALIAVLEARIAELTKSEE